MALLDDRASALAAMAHWKTPRPEKDGSYRFALENDLSVTLLSPDGRRCVLRAELLSLPPAGPDREELLRSVLRQQAGICAVRASVVALERPGDSLLTSGTSGDCLILQSLLELDVPQRQFDEAVRDFLNDLSWWKRVLHATPGKATGGESPFAMPDRFFGGVY
ncbi:hypothetical protein [uncultured Desulfovibrio sp.]|uniref:hypothetical protein n=1 Tax=uncultured Desulfovibrio sp. TaxID=167968 RepID=UPI00261B1F3A|nr:hypothetical protein [uncultured Desulfovibrio sp.]